MNKELLHFSLINIDKPAGPTSFTISNFLRKKLGLKKTSHMGTLDPKVTGVLPITLGRACKLAGYFITHNKTYIGILHTHKPQEKKHLQKLINENFLGEITQTPPNKSAVKRQARKRTVYSFTITEEAENKRDFLFECEVEGGTYIRKLCSDLGEMIEGAHMEELRRTKAGIFDEKTIITLYEFEKRLQEGTLQEILIPAEKAITKILPTMNIHKQTLKTTLNGKPLNKKDIITPTKELEQHKKNTKIAVFCEKQFVGVYNITKEKNIYARPEFVYN